LADQWVSRFGGLVDEGKRRASTLKDYKRHLTVDLKPLRARPAKAIVHPDISAVIEEIEADRGGSEARAARATLSSMCSWALETGRMLTNPVIGSYKPEPGKARERVLLDHELREVWHAAGAHGGDLATIVRLLILTGQRREEIGGLRWSEIDTPNRRLDLPGIRTKNGRPHLVPLGEPALELLSAVQRRMRDDGEPRDLAFGVGAAGFSGWSHGKSMLDVRIARRRAGAAGARIQIPHEVLEMKNQWARERAVLAALGEWALPHWTWHDLRRSFSTHANELGLAEPHVVDAFINHISGQAKAGVAGTYNRAAYWQQRVKLARCWTEHVISIVAQAPRGS
jgi:integrase